MEPDGNAPASAEGPGSCHYEATLDCLWKVMELEMKFLCTPIFNKGKQEDQQTTGQSPLPWFLGKRWRKFSWKPFLNTSRKRRYKLGGVTDRQISQGREAVASPSLELLKIQTQPWAACSHWPFQARGVGLDNLHRPLPTFTVLQFCVLNSEIVEGTDLLIAIPCT